MDEGELWWRRTLARYITSIYRNVIMQSPYTSKIYK
jgi:hypothetical protein